nr:retrovirus-related Pol polyprotein from transposon TNT 1-94 [Tanacetum cinerariifolium]
MKIKESLNIKFDETPPPSKTSPLMDDDLDEEDAVKVTVKKNLENDIEDETLEIDNVLNIKESRNHPLENVIGTLTKEPLGTKWVYRNKLDENGIISQNTARNKLDENGIISQNTARECPKAPKEKNQRAFIGGSWSDSGEEDDEKDKDETCLMAQASSEICLRVDLEPDEWIKDNGCSTHMTSNRKLFSTYKAYNGGQICDNKCRVTFSKHDSEITKYGKVIDRGYSQNSKAYIILNKHTMKIKESLNIKFDETPPPSKTSPLMDDDLDEEDAVKVTVKKNLENDIEDETLEIDNVLNIKESRNHPLENVIGTLTKEPLGLKSNWFH